MAFARGRSPRWASGIRLTIVAALVVLVLLPTGTLAAPRSTPASAGPCQASPSATFTAIVCWNGVNVNTAGSASSALSVDFSTSANVTFTWSTPTGVGNPNDARLQMIYFGFSLATRDVVNSGTQNFADMSWTPGAIVYILEGVFEITASLIQPNGTTLWSENFWVHSSAPYSILALLPIVLILIIAWELYSVARSGRQAMLSQKKGKAPPSAPEAPAPTEPTAAPPAAEETPPSEPEESP